SCGDASGKWCTTRPPRTCSPRPTTRSSPSGRRWRPTTTSPSTGHVELHDVRTHPIEEITERGVKTAEGEFPVDAIVFATGFDTMTGTLFKMGIKGRNGVTLDHKWADGPRTYLGLTTHGFGHVHDHRAAEPVGAVQHAGGHRAE